MQTKLFFLIIFLSIMSCSSKEELSLNNYIPINKNTLNLNFLVDEDKNNSYLSEVLEIKNIFNPEAYKTLNSMIKLPPQKIWEIDTNQKIDDKNPSLPKPIFIESNVYILNNEGSLFKINGETGKIIWKQIIFSNLENTIIGTPALSGKLNKDGDVVLYLHNGSDELVAFNANNESRLWSFKSPLPFRGGITVTDDFLFVSDFEGNFFAFNTVNGKIVWSTFLGSDSNSIYTAARPILVDKKIVVPGTGGSFFIISLDNGKILWTENISSNKELPKLFHTGDIVANPINDDINIYLVSQSGITTAFNINTSEKLWSVPFGGFETPSLSGETIFIVGNSGSLVAIDKKTGYVRWKKDFPRYTNENSYFKDKELILYKGPTLVDSHLLLSTQDGKVKIFDANNGKETGVIKVGKLATSPMPVEKKLYFLTVNGKLISYK